MPPPSLIDAPSTVGRDRALVHGGRGRAGRGRAALAGGVAAAAALAAGELVAAVDPAGPSLVSAVGDEVIDAVGASLKDVAIQLFGTNDKPALVVGIVVSSIALGALLGIGTRRSVAVGPVGLLAFGVLGGWAYQRAPLTEPWVGWAAALVAAATGSTALTVLLRTTVPGAAEPGASGTSVRPGTGAGTRRAFFGTAAAMAAGAAAVGAFGRRLRAGDPVATARAEVLLPAPDATTPVPDTQPFQAPGLSPYVTPTADFYRIDTALTIPRVDPARWRLDVSGLVDRPFSLSYEDLLAVPSIEVPVTLQCVSNEVGGDLVGNARWQGVPLHVLLDRAGARPEGTQVVGRSVDGWTAGFPTRVVGDGRTALVAYAMNGEPLPARHGFPARLVVAGLYGYVSATKWLEEIRLTPRADVDGYWISRGWSKEGPIKTTARIDVPRSGAPLLAGVVVLAGVAWAPARGISAVDVRVDGGPWMPCELGRAASDETWVQWRRRWDAPPGDHLLEVRATDGEGVPQVGQPAPPEPDGATGFHSRFVRVRAT